MRRLVCVAALLSAIACQGYAQALLSDDGVRSIDGYLEDVVDRTYIPGLVALVVDESGITYSGAHGMRNVAENREMTVDTIFRIASMTKPITSLAVMMLIEERRLSLDDPIGAYIPDLGTKEVFESFDPADGSYTTRPAAREITIRHLLTHTSGLGYSWSNETLYRLVGSQRPSPSTTPYPLLYDPGTRWTYGESTRVLGRLIEVISDEPLQEFLQARIFDPLGMADTGYSVPDDKRDRVATAHTKRDQRLFESPNPEAGISTGVRGDGGLFSTASDYAKFIRMILNGGIGPDGARLLSEASVDLMGQNHIGDVRVELQPIADSERSRPFPLGAGRDYFGLGFQITTAHDDADMRSPGSMSWAGIMNTQFWIDPGRGIGAVLLMQYLPFYDEIAIETLNGFEERVYRHLSE